MKGQYDATVDTFPEAVQRYDAIPDKFKELVDKHAQNLTQGMRWIPNPGPQTEAYFSKADVLLYGGEPGGGKTDLILGLAFNCHKRSIIMRRQYTDLGFITDRAIQLNGSRNGYVGTVPPKLKLDGGDRQIDFAAAQRIGDEQHWMGNPHDFFAPDEATQFVKSQIEFMMGWVRTTDPNQRCRVVMATNPPLTAEGYWVNEMFAPWLDDRFSNPAKPGELRWCVRGDNDQVKWVDGPEPVLLRGKMVTPKSFTYIPATVEDNPYYAATDYGSTLENMPDEIRTVLLGHFKTTIKDQRNQVIPTDWIREAMQRWDDNPRPADGVPMCAMGVDCSGGGNDPMVIARRYDGWFERNAVIPGYKIPSDRAGAYCGGEVISYRRDNALIVVDMGGGYGGPVYEHLKSNSLDVRPYKGLESTTRRTWDKTLKFSNKRSAAYWGFREALDPGQPGGSPIMLPSGSPMLLADLTAPTFEVRPNGITIETKEDIRERLGRSTNDGDAVVMCWFEGPRATTDGADWVERRERGGRGFRPKVISGGRMPLTARRMA